MPEPEEIDQLREERVLRLRALFSASELAMISNTTGELSTRLGRQIEIEECAVVLTESGHAWIKKIQESKALASELELEFRLAFEGKFDPADEADAMDYIGHLESQIEQES